SERERIAGLGVCALQLSSLLLTAAVFFATPRLRTPYDPYALILIAALAVEAVRWFGRRRRGSELPSPAPSP
ncbi:hypothetical protein RZS08_54555, partial [Arthrospira platensis SPKY1]|nr:hypothetical protein [Arthrospira platensis SPKY1]